MQAKLRRAAKAPWTPLASLSISPLQMANHLVLLARDADRAGFATLAAKRITLVHAMLDSAAGA